jgi:uncharacterized membrane protein
MILSEIRQEARGLLQGRWTELIPIWFIFFLITAGASSLLSGLGGLITLVIGGPLTMGITFIFLKVYNREAFELGQLFDGFKDFSRTFTAYLLIAIYVFLWMLLLIVPGIIAALGYSMTFFIMAEDPNIAASDAMRRSKEMMFGHKTELFMLGLSFLGWAILASIPFGIGWLWLESYIYASFTIFYKRIKGETAAEPVAQPEPAPVDETIN